MTARRNGMSSSPGELDYNTARPKHRTTDEQTHHDAQRANARKNLAAMCCDWHNVVPGGRNVPDAVHLAARDFAELADILGLDAP